MAWEKALLRRSFHLDVDGVGKLSFRNSFRGGLASGVEGLRASCTPHSDIFTTRFSAEIESLVLLDLASFKSLG